MRCWPGIPLFVLTLFCSAAWAQEGLPYQTGFEAAEGFAPGTYVREGLDEVFLDSSYDYDHEGLMDLPCQGFILM